MGQELITLCMLIHSAFSLQVSLKNNAGESPLDVAKKYTQFKCISVLGGRS